MSSAAKMPTGPDEKSEWWRAASWVLGLVIILEVVALFTGHIWSRYGLFVMLALVFVVVASFEYGIDWLRKGTQMPTLSQDGFKWPIDKRELPEPKPGTTYLMVQAHPPVSKSKHPKVGTLTPAWYVLYWTFWRAPINLGDAVLSVAYQFAARAMGIKKEPQISGSTADWDEQEPRGPTPF